MSVKAQVLSFDFLIAASIFLLVVSLLFSRFTRTWNEISETVGMNDIIDKASLASQIWSMEGIPKYWNSTNVISLGLVNDHKFNQTKIQSLNDLGYQKVKEMLSLGNYEFYFKVTNTSGHIIKIGGIVKPVIAYHASQDPEDIEIKGILNESGLVWDFYWGGAGAPSENNARYVYTGDKTQLFKDIIANLSNYNTVIAEDPHAKTDALTSSEKQALKDWVFNGGTYFHIQHEEKMIREVFGPEEGSPTSDEGTVVNLDDILKGVKIGDQYTFEQATRTFSATTSPLPIKVIMEVTGDSTRCLFCKWTHGQGAIYYMPDVSDKITGVTIEGLDVVGTELKFGKYPSDASDVVKVERMGILNRQIVFIENLVWK